MNTKTLPLAPLFEEMGLPLQFSGSEHGLVRWVREIAPGCTSVAVIDISEEGEDEFVLTFNRSEMRNGRREGEMIIFDALYRPGGTTIEVAEQGTDDPETLYEAFRLDLDGSHLEQVV